jgi:formylglycine-generating enzyme required for sulfatase activity
VSNPLLLTVLLSAVAAPQSVEPPPGLVFIRGGTTKIGSPVKEIEAIGMEKELVFPSIVPETPQHSARVDDFFLMTTEVTNEQYAAFVQATGARPPWMWGEAATNEARQTFLEEQALRIQAARDEGKPAPERKKFDAATWWKKNWEGKQWQVPAGKESQPVTWIDYQDARAYARWAGLRLMTEFEYQRACRGNSARLYPWGDDPPETDRCASLDSRINEPLAAGALPKGATSEGIRHLAGNVWEWTASPFTAYPKYQDLKIEIGRGKQARQINGIVKWDANQRVAVGGSFQNGTLACRATTRRPTDRVQTTDALGFRCAASIAPGLDQARTVMKDDLPLDQRPEDVVFDETKVLAMDKWTGTAGSAGDVEGYAVIQDYDYVLYVPCIEVDAVSVKGIRELSLEHGVVTMGVLSTTIPVVEPALSPGTYYVSFRGASEAPETSTAAAGTTDPKQGLQDPATADMAAPVAVPPGYEWEKDNFIFYSADDVPVASWPAEKAEMTYVRPKKPEIVVGKGVRLVEGPPDKNDNPTWIEEPVDVASFKVNSWVRVSNKGFHYSLRLMFAPGTVGDGWRH